MLVFFDTEFTGLQQDTTLLSIGLVSEDGKQFYAEFTDYDKTQIDDWLEQNVIKKLIRKRAPEFDFYTPEWYHLGTTLEIRDKLKEWFAQFDSVELVSDVCHYDMVLLIDLFGTAWDLPKHICPACHDINQDIAWFYGIGLNQAFDVSRVKMLSDNHLVVHADEHNALSDAHNIKSLYLLMNGGNENENKDRLCDK